MLIRTIVVFWCVIGMLIAARVIYYDEIHLRLTAQETRSLPRSAAP